MLTKNNLNLYTYRIYCVVLSLDNLKLHVLHDNIFYDFMKYVYVYRKLYIHNILGRVILYDF